MNCYKLNSNANFYIRKLISDTFSVPFVDVYKEIKTITKDNIFIHKNGKQYELRLIEI